jgi:hypothetical protein
MFFVPIPPEIVTPKPGAGAIDPPPPSRTWSADYAKALERDAAEAAKEYVKPGRQRRRDIVDRCRRAPTTPSASFFCSCEPVGRFLSIHPHRNRRRWTRDRSRRARGRAHLPAKIENLKGLGTFPSWCCPVLVGYPLCCSEQLNDLCTVIAEVFQYSLYVVLRSKHVSLGDRVPLVVQYVITQNPHLFMSLSLSGCRDNPVARC